MAQQPAYTNDEIIAAGRALRNQGVEPTRPRLWTELGRREQPQSAWAVWRSYCDREPAGTATAVVVDGETSPALNVKLRAHQTALGALLEQVRREAVEPFERELNSTRAALRREAADREDLVALVHTMEAELANRDERIASLQRDNAPSVRLILP